jgi:hypothetical protein
LVLRISDVDSQSTYLISLQVMMACKMSLDSSAAGSSGERCTVCAGGLDR